MGSEAALRKICLKRGGGERDSSYRDIQISPGRPTRVYPPLSVIMPCLFPSQCMVISKELGHKKTSNVSLFLVLIAIM